MVEVNEPPPKLVKTKPHTIEAVIDRLVIREGIRPRLAESLDLALKLADGRAGPGRIAHAIPGFARAAGRSGS